ncbi:MotA/TolQ/ExbB proton channel family protein [bacterium]|nr:MotA/TolQ/ExbB proton channel family protein [bacterium]
MKFLLKLIMQGGYIMIPISLCSLIALTIVFERLVFLNKKKKVPLKLVKMIKNYSEEKVKHIIAFCKHDKSPLSEIVKKIILNRHLPHSEVTEIIQVTGRQETECFDRGLFLLDLIAAITPLMGLLGTVLGMIQVFNTISHVGSGQAQALSAGISKALITTVAGLIVAIPSLAFLHF